MSRHLGQGPRYDTVIMGFVWKAEHGGVVEYPGRFRSVTGGVSS